MIDVGYEVELQYDIHGHHRGEVGTVAAVDHLGGLEAKVKVEFPVSRDLVDSVWVPDGAVELA